MKELKILLLISAITLVTYFGIEPLAHSIMHPHVEPAEYKFKDLSDVKGEGDIERGKVLVGQNCKQCHTINSVGYNRIASKEELERIYGTASNVEKNFKKLHNRYLAELYTSAVPLDLSNVATIFDEKFLKNFIKNPANASFDSTYRLHKEKKMHLDMAKSDSAQDQQKIKETIEKDIASFVAKQKIGMYGFEYLGDQAINDIVAYLKSIAKPLTPKESLELACARCHGVAYAKIEATTPIKPLAKYLGTVPPDLSMMIRSKGADYLKVFLNDPQKVLIGSSMPRVGISEETERKIVSYLESVGDSKKAEREALGIWVILYFVIFTILAYLWKRNIWKDIK